MTAITRKSFIAVTGAMALSLMGCGGNGTTGSAGNPQPKAEPEPEPLDLSGTWKAEGEDPDSWQEIIISGNTMTINWVSDGGDTKALYWAGTYTAPSEPSDTWSWTSENDHEQTDMAIMASTSDTKDFEYDGESISYDVSALGVTRTLHAVKQ